MKLKSCPNSSEKQGFIKSVQYPKTTTNPHPKAVYKRNGDPYKQIFMLLNTTHL